MSTEILVALISACVSVLSIGVSVFVFVKQTAADQSLAKLNSELAQTNNARSARLDYEYDARGRLYREVEPLLFSAHLAAKSLADGIATLTDRIRDGSVGRDKRQNWLKEPYFRTSTIYRMFLPMAYYRLMSQRMSALDVTLEPLIGRKFMLLGIYSRILSSHFELAEVPDFKLDYDPYASPQPEKPVPAVHSMQGLVRGDIEDLVAAMLKEVDGRPITPLEWTEFDKAAARTGSPVNEAIKPVAELLSSFHPSRKPILWRELICFRLLADFSVYGRLFTIEEFDQHLQTKFPAETFYYRNSNDEDEDDVSDEAMASHSAAAMYVLRKRIEDQFATLKEALDPTALDVSDQARADQERLQMVTK